MSLHAKLSVLSHLLTAWGRLRAGDYDKMRRMTIRLPRTRRQQSLPLEQVPPVAELAPPEVGWTPLVMEQTSPVKEYVLSGSVGPPRKAWG